MNKQWIAFQLSEAIKELSQTIVALQSQPDFDDAELQIAMTHAYSHLNTAWNARNVDDDDAASASEQDFYEWIRFPADLTFLTQQ